MLKKSVNISKKTKQPLINNTKNITKNTAIIKIVSTGYITKRTNPPINMLNKKNVFILIPKKIHQKRIYFLISCFSA